MEIIADNANISIMKIIIHSKNIELTPAVKAYVEEKIGSLSRFMPASDELLEARVEVGKPSQHHHEGDVFYSEANLKFGKNLLRATHQHHDLYVAIDRVRDEIEAQMKKFKEKRADLARQPKE